RAGWYRSPSANGENWRWTHSCGWWPGHFVNPSADTRAPSRSRLNRPQRIGSALDNAKKIVKPFVLLERCAVSQSESADLETDPRFPSGPWTGFFLQRMHPGRNMMDLHLTFRQGVLKGEGRDWVGRFIMRGRYNVEDGKCYWTKTYIGQHDVAYQG